MFVVVVCSLGCDEGGFVWLVVVLMIGNFFFFFLVVVADGWIFFWLRFFVFVLWPLVVLTVVGSEFAIVYVVFTLCVR